MIIIIMPGYEIINRKKKNALSNCLMSKILVILPSFEKKENFHVRIQKKISSFLELNIV